MNMDKLIPFACAVLFLVLGCSAVQYPTPSCYKETARMPTCIDKYAAFPNHLNCRQTYPGHIVNISDQGSVELWHNELRAAVSPRAANMMQMAETTGLLHQVERWSRLCDMNSNWYERSTPGAYAVGQNTYLSPTKMTWREVLDVWIKEKSSFTYNGQNDVKLVGNYTQMISARTTIFGCATSQCRNFNNAYFYLCIYAPMLPEAEISLPYKKALNQTGVCEDCQKNCNQTAGLCECQSVTCLGGSSLNLTTCECECLSSMGSSIMYDGNVCEVTCNDTHGDDPACGKAPFTNDSCDTNPDTMFHCPYMCYVCPYSGKTYAKGSELLPWEKGLPNCTTTTTTTPAIGGSTAAPSGSVSNNGNSVVGPGGSRSGTTAPPSNGNGLNRTGNTTGSNGLNGSNGSNTSNSTGGNGNNGSSQSSRGRNGASTRDVPSRLMLASGLFVILSYFLTT